MVKPATRAKPLAAKLGIKPGMTVTAIGVPPGYRDLLGELPEGVDLAADSGGSLGFVHLFARRRPDLERGLASVVPRLDKAGVLWISWPKGKSPDPLAINREAVRGAGLAAGLVDVKVCSVDEVWSALKFVYRLADR